MKAKNIYIYIYLECQLARVLRHEIVDGRTVRSAGALLLLLLRWRWNHRRSGR